MEEFLSRLEELKAQSLEGEIPGSLFYEVQRQLPYDDYSDSCWGKSFELAGKYIETLEEYVKYLEKRVSTASASTSVSSKESLPSKDSL